MDRLSDFGCWLVDNFATIADLAFTGAVAFAAIVGIRLNRRLVEETSHLRRAETDPFVAIYIEYQRLRPSFFDMVIQNVGRGPAHDINFSIDPDIPIWVGNDEEGNEGNMRSHRLTNLAVFRSGIKFMAPMQEIRFFFGAFQQLTKEAISIKSTYYGAPAGRRRSEFSETFVIDVGVFDGMGTIGTPPAKEVADALKRIQRDIERIRKGGSWSNMNVTVSRRYFFSRAINERWFHLVWSWRNQQSQWQHGQHPWQRRWKRLRRLVGK